MNDLESEADSGARPTCLSTAAQFLKHWPTRDKSKDLTECPDCHTKYDWQTMANEPFRTVTDDDGRNKRKVCEDCYFEWVGGDISRYFGNIEETSEGFCYVKDLHEQFDSR